MKAKKKSYLKNISKIREKRSISPSIDELCDGIFKSDKVALARAITLIESTLPQHLKKADAIIEKCVEKENTSIRIGITGVPGVGKSTFIEAFGKQLTAMGEKVAVLAVDPSSTQTKGSILGDKTRMQDLVKDANAFIRPSPSGVSLGGVTRKTRESIILCEAAGYTIILIETVGVGQSETAVHSMVDFFLVLKLPGAGDELQGIKRGIIEMADAIVINKADGNSIEKANIAKMEFTRALQLYPPKENGWYPKVLTCSAIENDGLNDIWTMISNYVAKNKKDNVFQLKRQQQNKNWLLQSLDDQLKMHFYQNDAVKPVLKDMIQEVIEAKISPFKAAEKLLSLYHNSK